MTAAEFVQSPEVTWLRQATLRHHNRLASRVASAMGMSLQCVVDMEAVGAPKTMLLPTASCFYRDISLAHNKVLLSSDAALLHQTKSGVVFDCFSNEGFWVFMGPRDYSSYKIFGSEFCTTSHLAFPTKAICFHDLYSRHRLIHILEGCRNFKNVGLKNSNRFHTEQVFYYAILE